VALASCCQTSSAGLVNFDFSNVKDAAINFNGSTDDISFVAGEGAVDFSITASSGTLLGLKGHIDGTFKVGTITTVGNLETASLTTSNGLFSVVDANNVALTADLDWKEIFVFQKTIGGLNAGGAINLTNISYSGNNADLISIKNGSQQTTSMSFQFVPSKTLAQLMADGANNSTSYSGSLNAVPEPSSCALLGIGALGTLACVRRRRRS
jgi:hypothetical protein